MARPEQQGLASASNNKPEQKPSSKLDPMEELNESIACIMKKYEQEKIVEDCDDEDEDNLAGPETEDSVNEHQNGEERSKVPINVEGADAVQNTNQLSPEVCAQQAVLKNSQKINAQQQAG